MLQEGQDKQFLVARLNEAYASEMEQHLCVLIQAWRCICVFHFKYGDAYVVLFQALQCVCVLFQAWRSISFQAWSSIFVFYFKHEVALMFYFLNYSERNLLVFYFKQGVIYMSFILSMEYFNFKHWLCTEWFQIVKEKNRLVKIPLQGQDS